MKKTVIAMSLCTLGFIIQAKAQSLCLFKNDASANHQKMINAFITNQKCNTKTTRKPTGLQQRVVAQYIPLISDIVSIDSCTYKYTGNRTSSFNYDNLFLAYNTDFEHDAPFFSIPQFLYENTEADTIVNFYNQQQAILSTANYNAQNKIDSFKLYATNRYERTYNLFTTQNNLKAIIKKDASGDTIEKKIYTYNATESKIISDSSLKDGIQYKSDYHYNAQNLVDSISIFRILTGSTYLFDLLTFEYNNTGKLQLSQDFRYLQNGLMEQYFIDSFAYANNVDFVTYHHTTQIMIYGIGVVDSFYNLEIKYVGANNLPDSMETFYNFDNTTFHKFSSGIFSYNSNDNIVSFKFTRENLPPGENRYYYETFGDTTTTPTALLEIVNDKKLSIYPNPFSNYLSIYYKGNVRLNVEMNLVNILGQSVYKQQCYLNTGNNSIPVQDIPAGNYILLVKDEKGNLLTKKVTKH